MSRETRRRLYPEQLEARFGEMNLQTPLKTGFYEPKESKVDLDNVPNPIVMHEADQEVYRNEPYYTNSRRIPPLACTDYESVDDGNCSPRYMRMTTHNVAMSDEVQNQSGLPFGVVIQPMYYGLPIEVIQAAPVRCRRCKAYMNPSMVFIDGGRKFKCNLCYFENDVPLDYYSSLDMHGKRADLNERPELRYGTVEYLAGKEFISKPPRKAGIVIAIDVSLKSLETGMLHSVSETLLKWLYSDEFPATELAIVAYNTSMYCFDFSQQNYRMLVVKDDPLFVPLETGFLCDIHLCKNAIVSFLKDLPDLFAQTTNESVLLPLVSGLVEYMEPRGGKIVLFHASFAGIQQQSLNDEPLKIKDPKYQTLAEKAAIAGICIDLFLFTFGYMDVATVGILSHKTGGEMSLYSNFSNDRDGDRLYTDVVFLLHRQFGYNALMRVRATTGIRAREFYGAFHSADGIDVVFGGIDDQKTVALSLTHDSKLLGQESTIQVAILYTSLDGRRLIRVHTLTLQNTNSVRDVFAGADAETCAIYLAKIAAFTTSIQKTRQQLTERTVKILSGYRKHCAERTAPGMLILPETCKLLPLYVLSLLKSPAFRLQSNDLRAHFLRQLMHVSISNSIPLLYPRMYALHQDGFPRVKLSQEQIQDTGCYISDTGSFLFCYLGRNIDFDFMRNLFNTTLDNLDTRMTYFPTLPNELNQKVRGFFNYICQKSERCLALKLVRQNIDQTELDFLMHLVEDKTYETNYVDFLVQIHRQIQIELRGFS